MRLLPSFKQGRLSSNPKTQLQQMDGSSTNLIIHTFCCFSNKISLIFQNRNLIFIIMCAFMCRCVYVRMYMHVSVHVRACLCMCMCSCVSTHVYHYQCIPLLVCVPDCVWMNSCVHECTRMDTSKSLQQSALDRGYKLMTPIMDQNCTYSWKKQLCHDFKLMLIPWVWVAE